MRWAHLFSGLVVLVPLSGCIVFVPDFEPIDNCPIRGDSLCGTCLRTNCQAEINDCCGTEECRESAYSFEAEEAGTTMAALDTCASGDPQRCESALRSTRYSGAGDRVRSCLGQKCRAECVPGSTITTWDCNAPHGTDECSSCIYSKCESQLASCCGASGCASLIKAEMTACTFGDAPGCAVMADGSTTGQPGVVRACVKKSCATACFGNGRPHQSCTLYDGGAYCSCHDAPEVSGDECSTKSVPDSHCFVSDGWCTCGHYACKGGGSFTYPSCSCNLSHETDGSGPSATCNPKSVSLGGPNRNTPATCCIELDSISGPSCACDTSKSGCSGGFEVLSCDQASFLRAMVDLETDRCSQ